VRRVDYLITDIRRISRNQLNPDGTASIPDEEILQYLNDAQDRLQGLISATKGIDKIFSSQALLSLVGQQEAYTIPDRLYINKSVDLVEYSSTGSAFDYVPLTKLNLFNRNTNQDTYPMGYFKRGGQIYLVPTPSTATGTLRVTYERTVDDLDKRRGGVQSVSGLTSTGFTNLTVDSTADETSSPNLASIDYICIVDKDGNRKAYNIPVGSYITGTNVLTPAAGYTFQTGETIAAGDFIVFGKYHTTHSQLPEEAESYLIHYAVESMLHKDSSDDVVTQGAKLRDLEEAFIRGLTSQTSEIQKIPQQSLWEW
jgi:hypothetical protein